MPKQKQEATMLENLQPWEALMKQIVWLQLGTIKNKKIRRNFSNTVLWINFHPIYSYCRLGAFDITIYESYPK